MKQILVMMAAVVLVGCGKDTPETSQAAEAEPQLASKPTPVSPADEKLIADPIVEKAVRKSLNKNQSKLTEADLAKVTRLFIISNTEITDAGFKDIAKLQNLTNLGFYATKITDKEVKELATLQILTNLGLASTEITDAGLKEVAKLQQLTSLNLNNTPITDAGLKEVAKLPKLLVLILNDTKITKAAVAEFKKAFPNCSIFGP